MIKLLIVDDEPFTVDGLFDMLEETSGLDLDLYRAYSPEEALEWLRRTRIDIVLSDVRMPGMNGLELQTRIIAQWPRCKIIFLTGIHDLHTAQQAIRKGTVDYILKTEGDEAILASIRRAIEALTEEARSGQFIRQARERLTRALPLMHREWFAGQLDARARSNETRADLMKELEIPLNAEIPVLPVIGRVDGWASSSPADRGLLLYAVQNIAEEYFDTVVFFPVLLGDDQFVWLLQPSAEPAPPGAGEGAADWTRTAAFVRGTLESVQLTCRGLLKLTLSLVCADGPAAWEQLSDVCERMRQQLMLGFGPGGGMLLTHGREQREETDALGPPSLRTVAARLERLLEDGLEEPFLDQIDRYAELPQSYDAFLRTYYTIATVLLAQSNPPEGAGAAESDINAAVLMNADGHGTRERAYAFLREAAAAVFEERRTLQSRRTVRLISKLHHYIHEHLHGDLSLTRLSEVAFLNPTYLSELYKQQTGCNLSEYIAGLRTERAKELLDTTQLKIHEIAERVGFETPAYFTRFFKKRTQLTPLEYRARA